MRVPTRSLTVAARVMRTILPVQANGPAYIVRAVREIAPMAYARHAQRRNNHAHRTLTCTGQVLYLKHYTGLRIRSNVLRIHFVSGLSRRLSVQRPHGLWNYLIPLQPRLRHSLKVGVRMHTPRPQPRPVGVQVNKLGVAGNNLGVSNLGVTTTRLGPSAVPSTTSCTLTSSTNIARSS